MDNKELIEKMHKFGQRALEDYRNEKIESLTPERVDNYLTFFSGWSATIEEELGTLEILGADYMNDLITQDVTNAAAEKSWNATEGGKKMIMLRHRMKALDKLISACKNRLKRLENQSYNRY